MRRAALVQLRPHAVSLRALVVRQASTGDATEKEAKITRTAGIPELVEHWGRRPFKFTCGALTAVTAGLFVLGDLQIASLAAMGTAAFAYRGYLDMQQTTRTVLRNFPVLGHLRYLLESVRPEIRQYFIESDKESLPFSREQRALVYQRAKGDVDALPFGTRRDVNAEGFEFALHSIYPTQPIPVANMRVTFGEGSATQPYSASLLNVSAMSFGAISSAAILALNGGAKLGSFASNTGEGGLSKFHLQPGGDVIWNIGTGYFGCRNSDGSFSQEKFQENALKPNVKMIELKLSQGAKPGKGGILPGKKVTPQIAEARGLKAYETSYSPSRHSAFHDAESLVQFVAKLRGLCGKPVGIKLCVGDPVELADIVRACVKLDTCMDFITVDGKEGGTGAAAPEFSNGVGMPLVEGLYFVHNLLSGAGIRHRVKVIASGKIISGFSMFRALTLGADTVNSARGFMFSLGCIQSLKCHANTCPTGIATQDEALIAGLDVSDKRVRAFNFHAKTVEAAADIIASCGFSALDQLRTRPVIMTRINAHNVRPLRDLYPPLKAGELLNNDWVAPTTEPTIRDRIFNVWNISTAKAAQAAQ